MSDYFTTDELAAFLRVKPRKIYDLVSKEEVPFSRVMGKLLFSKEEVANWSFRIKLTAWSRKTWGSSDWKVEPVTVKVFLHCSRFSVLS